MAQINLLPWREARRQQRQQQFFIAIAASLSIMVLIVYLMINFINGLIAEQTDRNGFLNKEITALNRQIKEIATLEKQRAQLLAKRKVIQQLQTSRPKAVKILDAIARTIPEGVHLEQVIREDNTVVFRGVAQSNARVSVFMRQLDDNAEFAGDAKLNVVQRTSTNDQAIRKFTVTVLETNPNIAAKGEES